MQRQDVNDLVTNIQQTVQKIIDQMHEYLRGFVLHTCITYADNVNTMNKLYAQCTVCLPHTRAQAHAIRI